MTPSATACFPANESGCTECQPQLRRLQRSIDQLCRENAVLNERIEQLKGSAERPEPCCGPETACICSGNRTELGLIELCRW
jgi:hypothetical protein